MAFSLSQYQAMCDAIAMGQRVVQYDGKRVEYHSISDLIKAKNLIEGDLIASGQLAPPAAGGVQRGSTTFASYDPN